MKYLNFEGLQYFYSKLSSSLASQYISQSNLKTINGQSLIGSGNISLLSNHASGTLTVGGTTSNVPTINIKRDDTPHPAIILNEGGQGGLASITFQHAGTGALGTTINRNGVIIAGKSSSDLLTAAGSTTSLKTINNQSLLGSGNITIEGGGISQQNTNIIVSLGDDSLTINGENPKTIEFFYNNRLVSGLDLNDYLPLSGGTMTGDIVRKDDQKRTIYTIGSVANGPWIQCFDQGNGRNITINGSEIKVFGGGGTATIPNNIRYAWDNIHFSLWPDNTTNRIYKFNLQKLIDDGYLIEE